MRKLKRFIKRVLIKLKLYKKTQPANENDSYVIDNDHIIIKRDHLEETLPIINELMGQDDELIPRRKITFLKWIGPILEIKGYYYLENIAMEDDDLVKKSLVLVNKKMEHISVPLQDVKVTTVDETTDIPSMYSLSGFEGKYNFSTIHEGGKPLPDGEYKMYLRVEVKISGGKKYNKLIPLGDVRTFLNNGFHSTRMEYFASRKEMRFNLLATYDLSVKTLKLKSTKLKDIDPTVVSLEAHKGHGFVYRLFYTKGFRLLYRLFKFLPMENRKIVFASDSRTDMSGNFKFVYDEMLKKQLDFDYHFLLKSNIGARKSYREIVDLAYHLATAKYIFLDDFYPMIYPLKIRANAELVQLWHAVGAFKTFGFSRIGLPGGPSPKSKNHRNYTKAIVSSKNVARFYAEGFGIDEKKVLSTGIPRTDVFFDYAYQDAVREKLYQDYPFLRDKKVITFAPTFRGNGQQSAFYPMEVLDLEKLYYNLKDEYVFLLKIHPFVKNDFSIPYEYSDFFYDFSEYREINNLLFVTDILITDYSSVCFEFALLNRPMLFFAYDVEEYVQKRDFYFDYHSFIPGPLVRSTEDILDSIQTDYFKMNKIKPFVHYYFDHIDGKSSQRVVDEIVLADKENN